MDLSGAWIYVFRGQEGSVQREEVILRLDL
jgi:hypothetical protein